MGDRNVYALNGAGRGSEAGSKKVFGVRSASLLTTDLALNRTVGLCVVPAGFVLQSYSFIITDIDTNASPTHAFTLGDSGDTDRIATTATTGQAGGTLTSLAATGLNYKFPADTEIIMTSTTAAATAAAGTCTLLLEGFME